MQARERRAKRYLVNAAALAAVGFFLLLAAGSVSAVAGTDVAVATPDIGFSNPSPVDGSTISILVTVHNLGDANATNVVVSASVTSTGELVGTSTVDAIAPQSQVETAIQWNVSGEGNMTVTITTSSTEADVQPANNNAISVNIFVRSRPDLKVDSVTFDNAAPAPGTVAVGIFATISNIGGSDATLVKVALYDGPPSMTNQIYNTTLPSGVSLTTPQTVSYYWNLANHGGRHDIYAVVEMSLPAEKPSSLDNNQGSGRLLVLTDRDFIVTTTQRVEFNPLFDGFVIVRGTGDLTLANSTFTLLQERDNQFDVIVESGGKLTLWNAHIVSTYPFGITLQAGGSVTLREGSSIGGGIASTGGGLWIYNSTVTGDVTGSFSPLWVEDSSVNGAVTLSSTSATFRRSSVSSPTNMALDGSSLSVEWLRLITALDPALALTGGSAATLAGIDSGSISVQSGSSASVWRMADFMVEDLTGIPIKGAVVQSRFALNTTLVSTVTTDATGRASAWLVTDLLSGGSPQYVGSYMHSASYFSYHASEVSNMAFYPLLTAESNTQEVVLTFDVIDPADLFAPTVGDRAVTTVWSINDFNMTGNLDVRGVLNIDGTMTVWQTRDFEMAIVINSGTVNISAQGGIRSNHAINIYLYNASELKATGGTIDVNAIVTFGSSTVNIQAAAVPRGSFVLMGSSFTIGGGTQANGAQLYARAGSSVILDGAVATFGRVDVQTTGDITVKDATLSSSRGITLRSSAADKSLFTQNSFLVCGFGEAMLEAHLINMTTTSVQGCSIGMYSADIVQARQTSFSTVLKGFRPGSTATLYDVFYPALDVDPSAIVTTYHRLTISAIDGRGNAVITGDYAIFSVPEGTDKGHGSLTFAVERDLQASQIALGFEDFTGNYRVTVTAQGTSAPPVTRDVVMDQPRQMLVYFPEEIVKPSSVEVVATVDPTTVLPGQSINITGAVALHYPNRADTLTPHAGQVVTFSVGAQEIGNTTADATGSFNWTGAFSPTDATPGTKQIDVRTTYNTVDGVTQLTLELQRAPPRRLFIVLANDSSSFDRSVGAGFTINGQVMYDYQDGSLPIPAADVLVSASFTNPPQPDAPPATHANGQGLFAITVQGRNSAKIYSLQVTSHDDAYGLNADPVPVVLRVGQAPTQTAGTGTGLTLYILLAVVAAAGAIGVFVVVNAKRKSVNYVECGNCGRPAHEGDKKCPSCGVEFEEDIAKCSHCASWIPANAVRCPKCNTEFKPVDEAIAAPVTAPEAAAPEGVQAEVTAPTAVKQPVAVKKKVLKTAEPAAPAEQPKADGPKFENPWDQPGATPTQPTQPASDAPQPPPKKPEEKKEKGLFDDL